MCLLWPHYRGAMFQELKTNHRYISHVNVTQSVPDISPLMPMHQDSLFVSIRNPFIKIRRSHNRLIFIIDITIPGETVFIWRGLYLSRHKTIGFDGRSSTGVQSSNELQWGDLTHWGRDKMAAFSQTTLSNAFSWMKILEFKLKIHWSLFLSVLLTIFQHWFW